MPHSPLHVELHLADAVGDSLGAPVRTLLDMPPGVAAAMPLALERMPELAQMVAHARRTRWWVRTADGGQRPLHPFEPHSPKGLGGVASGALRVQVRVVQPRVPVLVCDWGRWVWLPLPDVDAERVEEALLERIAALVRRPTHQLHLSGDNQRTGSLTDANGAWLVCGLQAEPRRPDGMGDPWPEE